MYPFLQRYCTSPDTNRNYRTAAFSRKSADPRNDWRPPLGGQCSSPIEGSIRYSGSGWGLFHWHGAQIPGDWILRPESLTPQVTLKTVNIEQRRAACEILGWNKLLQELDAKVIDRDADSQIGELLEVKLPDLPQPAKFLRVRCGTGREFAVGIPPEITSALHAQAWMIGVDAKEFTRPEIRT